METTSTSSDGDLLTRFVERRDEVAFASLVERHQALVQGVALRVLGTCADAEDATQAVFLTLARKSGALTRNRCLAPWLHHVARCVARTALDARRSRDHHERTAAREPRSDASGGADAESLAELRCRLDQELARLPERYRAPLILVHLEGRSLEDTAQILKRPLGTICACLSRGRTLLRARLGGGSTPVVEAALGLALAAPPAAAPASSAAIAASIQHTLVHGVHGATPGSTVLALSNGALHMLRLASLKLAATAIGVGVAVLAAGSVAVRLAAAEPAASPAPAPAADSAASAALAAENATLRRRIHAMESMLATEEMDKLLRGRRPEHDRVDYGTLAASGVLAGIAHADTACLFDPSGSLSVAAVSFLQLSTDEHAALDRIISDTLATLAADLRAHGAHGDGAANDRTAYLPALGQDALTARGDFQRKVEAVLGHDRGTVLLDCLQSQWNDRFLGFCTIAQTVHASRTKTSLHIDHHYGDTGNGYGGVAPSPTYALKFTLCAPYLLIDLGSKDAPAPQPAHAPSPASSGF